MNQGYEQQIADCERLVGEVLRDMPRATLKAWMSEAMKRNHGSMNPVMVRNTFQRLGPNYATVTVRRSTSPVRDE
jgi:hypothetical protein